MSQSLEPCAHASCRCPRSPFRQRHCSAYCAGADASEPPEGACACGHAACVEAQERESSDQDTAVSMGPGPGRQQGH